MKRKPDDRMDEEIRHLQVVQPVAPEEWVREAAEALRVARVDFAQAFIRAHAAWKGSQPLTDRKAQEMTVAATHDQITTAEAELRIALWYLEQSARPRDI